MASRSLSLAASPGRTTLSAIRRGALSFRRCRGGTFTVNGAPIPRDSALTTAGAQLYPDVAMDLACQVRGRVRQRLTDLRRHGHAALCVVSDLIEPPLSLIGLSRPIPHLDLTSAFGAKRKWGAAEFAASVETDPCQTLRVATAMGLARVSYPAAKDTEIS
jgi:hypothetical protein